MAEDMLLKFAQPLLIGIGLLVVINLWNLVQLFLTAKQSKETKIDDSIEKLTTSVIKLTFEIEHLQKDVNNIGQVIREIKNNARSG